MQIQPFGAFTRGDPLGQDAGNGNLLVFPVILPRRGEDTLRVLVVDDHPAFRRALTSALKMVKGIEVAGEAGGGRQATDRARVDEADLVLMDLSMPDSTGSRRCAGSTRADPTCRS